MREEKKFQLEEIEHYLDQYPSFVLLSYEKFKPQPAYKFRTDVLKTGGNLTVVPKRLFLKAALKKGVNLSLKDMPGHIAVVFAGKDVVETAKVVTNTESENKEAIKTLSGYLEGVMYSAADVDKLAKMPSKDVMRAQLLSTLIAPTQQTVSVMQSILTSLLYCLDEKIKQSEAVAS
jgi:large subunit ribosomal protein L10